jgi:hypothetical protein
MALMSGRWYSLPYTRMAVLLLLLLLLLLLVVVCHRMQPQPCL